MCRFLDIKPQVQRAPRFSEGEIKLKASTEEEETIYLPIPDNGKRTIAKKSENLNMKAL